MASIEFKAQDFVCDECGKPAPEGSEFIYGCLNKCKGCELDPLIIRVASSLGIGKDEKNDGRLDKIPKLDLDKHVMNSLRSLSFKASLFREVMINQTDHKKFSAILNLLLYKELEK